MKLLSRLHGGYVHTRRVRMLRDCLSSIIPQDTTVLDVGCGDGLLASLIMERRKDISISGIDVLIREYTRIPVTRFDGTTIPNLDKSFDVVMLVDVLHHTQDPLILMQEAARVARKAVVIKDHRRDGFLAGPTLRFMDWVGNAPHGVVLPFNYWSEDQWIRAFQILGYSVSAWREDLELYPSCVNWIFGRSLHFIARLEL